MTFQVFHDPYKPCKILNTSSVFVKGYKYKVGLGNSAADFMGLPFLFFSDKVLLKFNDM